MNRYSQWNGAFALLAATVLHIVLSGAQVSEAASTWLTTDNFQWTASNANSCIGFPNQATCSSLYECTEMSYAPGGCEDEGFPFLTWQTMLTAIVDFDNYKSVTGVAQYASVSEDVLRLMDVLDVTDNSTSPTWANESNSTPYYGSATAFDTYVQQRTTGYFGDENFMGSLLSIFSALAITDMTGISKNSFKLPSTGMSYPGATVGSDGYPTSFEAQDVCIASADCSATKDFASGELKFSIFHEVRGDYFTCRVYGSGQVAGTTANCNSLTNPTHLLVRQILRGVSATSLSIEYKKKVRGSDSWTDVNDEFDADISEIQITFPSSGNTPIVMEFPNTFFYGNAINRHSFTGSDNVHILVHQKLMSELQVVYQDTYGGNTSTDVYVDFLFPIDRADAAGEYFLYDPSFVGSFDSASSETSETSSEDFLTSTGFVVIVGALVAIAVIAVATCLSMHYIRKKAETGAKKAIEIA
eukprot:g2013.t1